MKIFSTYACLFMVVQGVAWVTLGRWDSAVVAFLFLYYPTIAVVERFGNYSGGANMIYPIQIGVPLGIVFYSIILATILTFVQRAILSTQSSE
jgi:hypothetical protein